jgi:hypothetical protein
MAVNQKRTHFGRAGEFFAMSEILLRGWNVAVPVVDVGDDVFIIDDNDKRTFRLQVKSGRVDGGVATFTLSRPQLRATLPIELLYMFQVALTVDGARGWGASLNEFLERWPESLPVLDSGPGSQ